MRTVSLSVTSNSKTYSDFSKLIERTQEVGGTRRSAQINDFKRQTMNVRVLLLCLLGFSNEGP